MASRLCGIRESFCSLFHVKQLRFSTLLKRLLRRLAALEHALRPQTAPSSMLFTAVANFARQRRCFAWRRFQHFCSLFKLPCLCVGRRGAEHAPLGDERSPSFVIICFARILTGLAFLGLVNGFKHHCGAAKSRERRRAVGFQYDRSLAQTSLSANSMPRTVNATFSNRKRNISRRAAATLAELAQRSQTEQSA